MAVKKRVTKKTPKATPRVSPKIPQSNPDYTIYEELRNGDCFLLHGKLYMKRDTCDQEAINLEDGTTVYDLCEDVVLPVNIKITWKKE